MRGANSGGMVRCALIAAVPSSGVRSVGGGAGVGTARPLTAGNV